MSIFKDIGRRNRNSKAVRALNALPPELQKDIGWPVTPRASKALTFEQLLLMAMR